MVQWYSPAILARTALHTLVSTLAGQRGDLRLVEQGPRGPHPYTDAPEIWFDYLADTGDGWDSTHAVASLIAQRELEIAGPGGEPRLLPQGRFLVIGGDGVYPYASARTYRERLVAPFGAASPPRTGGGPPPDLWAIPGNHDWYDGLVSFSRLFMGGGSIGAWRLRQERSYFALRLPHQWWLWAVDIQLEHDIDRPQWEYFSEIGATALKEGDRVILVSASPDWLREDYDERSEDVSLLARLERRVIASAGARVSVWIAGDYHFYLRHQDRRDPDRHRIVSGGGGAFLMPTHGPMFGAATAVSREVIRCGKDEFVARWKFPTAATSFRLSFLNVLFPLKNWRFACIPGAMYAAFTWAPAPRGGAIDLLASPSTLGGAALLVLAGWWFADERSPLFRRTMGPVHGFLHAALALATAHLAAAHFGADPLAVLARFAVTFMAGAIVGSLVFGLYLIGALNCFGAHVTEAFSALRIPDYKHFLRLHVDADGRLEIFPIGLPRTPRRREGRARYQLIEGPIEIPGRPPPGA